MYSRYNIIRLSLVCVLFDPAIPLHSSIYSIVFYTCIYIYDHHDIWNFTIDMLSFHSPCPFCSLDTSPLSSITLTTSPLRYRVVSTWGKESIAIALLLKYACKMYWTKFYFFERKEYPVDFPLNSKSPVQ